MTSLMTSVIASDGFKDASAFPSCVLEQEPLMTSDDLI